MQHAFVVDILNIVKMLLPSWNLELLKQTLKSDK